MLLASRQGILTYSNRFEFHFFRNFYRQHHNYIVANNTRTLGIMKSKILIPSLIIATAVKSFKISPVIRRVIHTKNANNINKQHEGLKGWTQTSTDAATDEWKWEEESDNLNENVKEKIKSAATPKLPSGSFKPKQSLGQNFLKDGNTVGKIVSAFENDVKVSNNSSVSDCSIVELGPGAGALTRPLYELYKSSLTCVELDPRSIELLAETYPQLNLIHKDVLQLDYARLAADSQKPLSVIGNLPYYITSQILFALADATHKGAIQSATVTMQWEVAQRIVASTRCKDYGILSIVFQLYSNPRIHFKIPPTVFYPKPKVDSALVGLHFVSPHALRERLAGVQPRHLRTVLSTVYQQRRKTLRNSVKKLLLQIHDGDKEKVKLCLTTPPTLPAYFINLKETKDEDGLFSPQQRTLPIDWTSKRPEELHPGQFVELTRLIYGPNEIDSNGLQDIEFPDKVWRKAKHGND